MISLLILPQKVSRSSSFLSFTTRSWVQQLWNRSFHRLWCNRRPYDNTIRVVLKNYKLWLDNLEDFFCICKCNFSVGNPHCHNCNLFVPHAYLWILEFPGLKISQSKGSISWNNCLTIFKDLWSIYSIRCTGNIDVY